MSAARSFPFGGIPVYNPQALSKTEALAQFHARQAAYSRLMDLLREERPSHVLIIGTRGMGKTTLLQRLRYGVEDDIELNGRYLALAFPEEQYNVNRLHHFLLNTVDALADALERLGDERMLARIEAYAESAGKVGREEIEDQVPKFLAEVSEETHRSFLLLVDNADRLFETIEDREQWALRDLLLGRRDLTLFGATTQESEGIYEPQRAFFEFFKVELLSPLTFQEVRDLLLQLSESVEETEAEKGTAKRRVEEWLAADSGRLRTLVQLTGGNPRTTVLLFHLVLDGLGGGAREYLEQLLDQCTPNYKGRVDELPAQSQQVLDAVSLRWDPATAMEIAADTGLETTAVSTHLTRLVRQGILEKADPGDSKKALYQVAERFFNIWYLMRASRRVRAKLRWFVEFLRVFFDAGELEKMAWERLERFRNARKNRPEDIETAFAYAIASRSDLSRFEDYLRRECAGRKREWIGYVDALRLPDHDHCRKNIEELQKRAIRSTELSLAEREARARMATENEPNDAENWRILGSILAETADSKVEAEAALKKAIELEPGSALFWSELGDFLGTMPERSDETEMAYRNAVKLEPNRAWYWIDIADFLRRTPERRDEAEFAARRAIELDESLAWSWGILGSLLATAPARISEAEAALRRAVDLDPDFAGFWVDLGDLLSESRERFEEAELAYRKAIDLDPDLPWCWASLGNLLAGIPGRRDDAEDALRRAIDLCPDSAWHWADLGKLLAEAPPRFDEAEAAYKKALDLDPGSAILWCHMGNLLGMAQGRLDEAETAYRKAIDLDQGYAWPWINLGDILVRTHQWEEAEAALRTGVNLDPGFAWSWADLGEFLRLSPQRLDEAEAAYRRAIAIDPATAWFWNVLGDILARNTGRHEEAEAAYREATTLDPSVAWFWADLGDLLVRMPGKSKEAEYALRKAVELDADDSRSLHSLAVAIYCDRENVKEAMGYLRQAIEIDPLDAVSAAILLACPGKSKLPKKLLPALIDASREGSLWSSLWELCRNYPPFGKILLGICDIVQKRDSSNEFARLHRALALAQLNDFPRASVALEDALTGDPIELLAWGREALETFFAAAVRNGRVRECLDVLDKKEWKDAWRPIYEALKAVEAGSGDYLKRVAVEIREPATMILRRIAPELRGLPLQSSQAT
jgi:tetratricopeptide (TPR) repeat protein